MSIKTFLKKLVPTWTKSDDLVKSNTELYEALIEAMTINRGLNLSAGEMWKQIEGVREEAIHLLSAIAFQYGGELTVKSEFFDVLKEEVNNNLNLKIDRQENGNVILKLVPDDVEEKEEENNE